MKLLLIGYGKMGKEIEQIALQRGHKIICKAGLAESKTLSTSIFKEADMALEFSEPNSAFENVKRCAHNGLSVVCGTTGWNEKRAEAEKICIENGVGFFYASNFAIGMNIFFEFNRLLAKRMNRFNDFDVRMEEIHHTQKKDSPSGTAISLAEGIMDSSTKKSRWINILDETDLEKIKKEKDTLLIHSKREGHVKGIHVVEYNSGAESLSIRHEAHDRSAFATGAVLAAEFLISKKGIFGMSDMLRD